MFFKLLRATVINFQKSSCFSAHLRFCIFSPVFPILNAARKHLFARLADTAPLDCVYWWPISVAPPLSSGRWGSGEGNPPQTITQSLISHMKESSESFTLTVVGKLRQNLVFRPEAYPACASSKVCNWFYLDKEFILDNCNVTRSITLLHFWKKKNKKVHS